MSKPFYADWSQAQILALVLDGIRRGKIKDQTILHTADEDAEEAGMAPVSEIIANAIKI
jgi:hypothetical protein